MELRKIISLCENAGEFAEVNINDLLGNHSIIVKGKDKFMSGWGMASGKAAYSLVLCKDKQEAFKIMEGMKKDGFIYVNYYYISGFKAIDRKNIYTFRLAEYCTKWNK